MTRAASPLLFTTMVMIIALLASSIFFLIDVVSAFQSGTSSSSNHIVKNLPSQILTPRQPSSVPLFASTDDKDDADSSTTTVATAPESIGEKVFAELDKMRQQFSELTESLNVAKEREEQAKGDVVRLTKEKNTVDTEKESFIAGKKQVLRCVFSTFTSCVHFQIILLPLTFRVIPII